MADQCLCNVFTRCHCKKSMLPSLHNSLDKVCLQIDKVAMGYAAIIFAVNFVTVGHLWLILCMFFFCAGVLCVLLMVYLMFTSLWILPTLYLSWQILDWDTPERGTAPSTWYIYFNQNVLEGMSFPPSFHQTIFGALKSVLYVSAYSTAIFSTDCRGQKKCICAKLANMETRERLFPCEGNEEYCLFICG